MSEITGSKAIVEELKRAGTTVTFGITGGSIMPLYDALGQDGAIRCIMARHEQGAAHMADGYARASRKPGVCIATSGPGATNLVTGIANAHLDSSPVLALTGQVPVGMMGLDAFQETDIFSLLMPVVKHNFRLMDADHIPKTFRKAFEILNTGRRGPVHIDLPKNAQTEKMHYETGAMQVRAKRPGQDYSRLGDAVKAIRSSERPVILAGGGVAWSGAGQHVMRLAELLMAPVVTTIMGKGSVNEDHPLALGTCGMHGKRSSNWALSNADLIIAIGTRFSDRITGNPSEFGKGMTIIHLDIDSSEIGKNVKTDIGLVGDAKDAISMLTSALTTRHATAWTDRIKELKQACTCDLNRDERPIKPQRVVLELSKNLPDRSIIATEVGQNQMWMTHFYPMKRGEALITSGGLGTMGFGLPAAIGAKAAQPDRTVIDVAGDGSLFMNCHELSTAVEEDLPVVVALLNNGWLGMVKQWQKLFFEKRYHMTRLGKKTDFVAVAKAFGADGRRIEAPQDLKEAITQAVRSGTPYVLDIATDPEEDILPMVPPGGKLNEMIGGNCPWKCSA